jgi:hypothetical protein
MKDLMATNIHRRQRMLMESMRYLHELEEVRKFIGPDDHKALTEWCRLYTAAFICKLRTLS